MKGVDISLILFNFYISEKRTNWDFIICEFYTNCSYNIYLNRSLFKISKFMKRYYIHLLFFRFEI